MFVINQGHTVRKWVHWVLLWTYWFSVSAFLSFCLPSTTIFPMKGASSEPAWAPVHEALLKAGDVQLLYPAPGKQRLLVYEYPEVPGSKVHMEGHTCCVVFPGNISFTNMPSSLNAEFCHLHLCMITATTRLLGLQAYLHACACVFALCSLFLRGLYWASSWVEVGCQHSGRSRQLTS